LRIVVNAPDIPPGRTKSHAVASYVRALIAYQAMRRELATAAVHVAHCKKAVTSRMHAEELMAEARALCEELGVDADIAPTPDTPC